MRRAEIETTSPQPAPQLAAHSHATHSALCGLQVQRWWIHSLVQRPHQRQVRVSRSVLKILQVGPVQPEHAYSQFPFNSEKKNISICSCLSCV